MLQNNKKNFSLFGFSQTKNNDMFMAPKICKLFNILYSCYIQ